MPLKTKTIDISGSAIICSHVVKNNYPILLAIRDVPIESEDSGWQFLCNSGKQEKEDEAQIWSINEVLTVEPTLKEFLNSEPGAVLIRDSIKSRWRKA
ncbi:MAG TPA: DUF2185 domain-containing protein [Geobacteraceae bacterium]